MTGMTRTEHDCAHGPTWLRLLRSEILKLATLPAVLIILATTMLIAGASAWLFSSIHDPASAHDPIVTTLKSVDYIQAGLLILGVVAGASEYPHTIRTTVVVTPRRFRVQTGKMVALTGCALLTAMSAIAITFATTRLILWNTAKGVNAGSAFAELASAVGYLTCISLIAYAVGMLVRHTLAGVTAVLGYFFVAGPLLRSYYAKLNWTPDAAGHALWQSGNGQASLGTPALWAMLIIWTVIPLAAAVTAFRLRDV